MKIVDWVPDILFFPLSSGLEFFWNVLSGRKKYVLTKMLYFWQADHYVLFWRNRRHN